MTRIVFIKGCVVGALEGKGFYKKNLHFINGPDRFKKIIK